MYNYTSEKLMGRNIT